jgi:RND family efflux transporter MFP subunit
MKNRKLKLLFSIVALLSISLLFAGCGKKTDEANKSTPATVITVTQVKQQNLQVVQEAVGQVDSQTAPFVAAEVAGRIVKVAVDTGQRVTAGQMLAVLDPQDQNIARQAAAAEVNRVQALLANQQRLVERYQKLVTENFISQSALESAESQLDALREQLSAAKSQLEASERSFAKTRIVAPIGGRVDQRMVAVGDYVTLGKPLFQLTTTQALRVRLPFPETVAPQLRTGLTVRLSTPTAPGKITQGRVSEIRPMVGANRAMEVIVDVPNPGDWNPGASVNGALIVAEHPQALVVPEVSLVLRPAGEVVYVINNNKAEQRVVRSGIRQDGYVEILSGLTPGEPIAVDGASFLTDKAPVSVREKPASTQGAA